MTRLIAILLTIATAHAASVRVSWVANPERDIRGYQVERVMSPFAPVLVETAATSLVVSDLAPGDHTFRIRAVNTSGMLGEWGTSAVYQVRSQTPAAETRLRITIYSSDSPTRQNRREEAILFQPITGPHRFWWAEITSSPR